MKTIKASLLLSLLTFLFSLALSGCYTQLAFVDDEQFASVEPAPPIIIPPPIIIIIEPVDPTPPIHPISPIWPIPIDPPSRPIIHPLPTAGSSSTVTAPPPSTQTRDTGYQRPDRSGSTPTTPDPDRRPSGPGRGGR